MTPGERIKEIRTKIGMSQVDFAAIFVLFYR